MPSVLNSNVNADGDQGYAKLAVHMQDDPGSAIFRTFSNLTVLNLLRLQAELHDLEHQLKEVREEDASSGDPIRTKYIGDFRLMRDWVDDGDPIQHDLLVTIGIRLKEYHSALSQALDISKAQTPTKRDLESLQAWIKQVGMETSFLNSSEDTVWSDENAEDFITLKTGFLPSLLNGAAYVRNGRKIQRSRAVSRTLTAVFLTFVVLVPFCELETLIRIGFVIFFTIVFGLILIVWTEGRELGIIPLAAMFVLVQAMFLRSRWTNGAS